MCLVGLLAAFGGFIWNALLAAVARLITYLAVCGAVPRLRAVRPDATSYRLPGGGVFGWLGIGYCVMLLLQMRLEHAAIVAAVSLAAALNWAWARRQALARSAS